MRTKGCESDWLFCSTRTLKITMLASVLFTVTVQTTSTTHSLQKLFDYSALVILITTMENRVHRDCGHEFLCSDASETTSKSMQEETKELAADSLHVVTDFGILDSLKYTGVHLNNKLDQTHNTVIRYTTGWVRTDYLLRRCKYFGVQRGTSENLF